MLKGEVCYDVTVEISIYICNKKILYNEWVTNKRVVLKSNASMPVGGVVEVETVPVFEKLVPIEGTIVYKNPW